MVNIESNRFYSKKQENTVAGLIQGRRTPNSGATHFDKGDVAGDNILIECKTLKKVQKSHTINVEDLDKIQEEAFARGKQLAALAFDFGPRQTQYFILREDDFQTLYQAWLTCSND